MSTRWVARLAGVAAWIGVGLLAVSFVAPKLGTDGLPMEDLDVYRRAASSFVAGERLYDTPQTMLPFTYPPAAALAVVPLAPLSQRFAYLAWTAAIVATLAYVMHVAFAALLGRVSRCWRPVALAALTGAAALLEPVTNNLVLGQINVFLVALVLADCCTTRVRWPRGVLVGIAASIKITPALFVLYLAVRGRWRAALVATGTAVAVTVAMFALRFRDSRDYWLDLLWRADRVGDLDYVSNQSVLGMLSRSAAPPLRTAVWLVVGVAVVAAALRWARGASQRGNELAAVTMVALGGIVVSPVSWIHHLIWVVVGLGVIVGDGRNPRRLAVAGALVLVFAVRFPWISENLVRDGATGVTAAVAGAAANVYGIAVLATMAAIVAVGSPRGARTAAPVPSGEVAAPWT